MKILFNDFISLKLNQNKIFLNLNYSIDFFINIFPFVVFLSEYTIYPIFKILENP